MDKRSRPQTRRLQPFTRMRAPIEAKPFALQWHVIQAIRRSPEIASGDSVYRDALEELLHRSVTGLLGDFNAWAKGLVSGKLHGVEVESAVEILDKACGTVDVSEEYPSIAKFNQDYLNGNGELALIFSLVIDAADVDVVALDEYRGGEALQAAYGPRRTQASKREGKRIQSLLKQWDSFDEDAMSDAADRYVVYRHVHHGSFTEYKIEAQLKGPSFSERRRLKSFNEFDRALGYPPPERGRPPNKTLPSKTPQSRPLQRKVHRPKGHRRS